MHALLADEKSVSFMWQKIKSFAVTISFLLHNKKAFV
jgi:hypothetical protein